jgi:hypothetical protein
MNRFILHILLLVSFASAALSQAQGMKILHLGFHKGCIDDIAEVAQELSLDITPWYILADRQDLDGRTTGDCVYNMTHERAQRVWERHKDYFNQFDVIMTSDTAPLARIFLQNNNWKKPLIIWICNRFDYADYATLDGAFPDQEFYDLFRNAAHNKNVKIISYTPYEHYYARKRGVELGTFTIRPIGVKEKPITKDFKSGIPAHVNKQETLFLYPRLEPQHVSYVQHECAATNIKIYHGVYNGPEDLKQFKGVLYFPYAWSNLALFENLQRGIVHFVPTERFVVEQVRRDSRRMKHFTLTDFHLCDWYCAEYRDLFVYFDSWQDLKHKIASTNYQALSAKVREKGRQHKADMMQRWVGVFQEIQSRVS